MTRQRTANAAGLSLVGLVVAGVAHAQSPQETELEEVVVTGFRQSLEDAALDKRSKTNFTDSVFAEDIGKFPDLNLAESLQRLPGIQIERERTAGIITGQWQPFEALAFNLDLIYAESENFFAQHDLMIMLRSTSNNVPFDVQANEDNILTRATFANAQLLSENRPYATEADFFNTTLGMDYQVTDLVKVKSFATFNDSTQAQSANTVLLRSPLGRGYTVTYDLPERALTPRLSTNFDINDPNLGWQMGHDARAAAPSFRETKRCANTWTHR